MNIADARAASKRVGVSTEIGQGWHRLYMALIILAGLGLARFWPAGPGLDAFTVLAAAYACYACCWIGLARRALLPGRVRRIAAIVIDQAAFGAGLYLGGAY